MEIFHSIIEWLEKRENPLITCTKNWNISGLLFNFEIKLTKPPYKILNLYTFVLPMINLIFPGNFLLTKLNTETLKLYSTSMNSLWVQASFFSNKTNRGTATDFQRLAIKFQKLYIIVFKTVYNSYTIEFFSRNWISRG